MKEGIVKILSDIDLEVDEIDLYGYDIIQASLSFVHHIQPTIVELRSADDVMMCNNLERFQVYMLKVPDNPNKLCLSLNGENITD